MRFIMLLWRNGGQSFDFYAKELGFSTSTPSKAGLKKVMEMMIRKGEISKDLRLTRRGVLKAGGVQRIVAQLGNLLNEY